MEEIPQELFPALKNLLIKHEDDRKRAYLDQYGNITAGIGHNLSARDIADDIRARWFREDSQEFYNNLLQFPWFTKLNAARQIAVIDMCFMGFKKFLTFEKFIQAMADGNYPEAQYQLMDSDYAEEVPERARELANIIVTGVLHV